jgi:transcriptional regulator with XRE-family HTH domain
VNDLKALRRRKHLSQKELAALVGVSHQTIEQWEAGTTQPRRAHIPKLAEALDIDAGSSRRCSGQPRRRSADGRWRG